MSMSIDSEAIAACGGLIMRPRGAEARVLASPALGAGFVECLLEPKAGQGGPPRPTATSRPFSPWWSVAST